VPTGDKTYRIRAVDIAEEDVARLLDVVLRDRERHFLPVFTHNVWVADQKVTTLIKRYSGSLRTLSLMGAAAAVNELVGRIRRCVPVREIPDPSNFRFIKPNLSMDFDYESLAAEEVAIFKKHYAG